MVTEKVEVVSVAEGKAIMRAVVGSAVGHEARTES